MQFTLILSDPKTAKSLKGNVHADEFKIASFLSLAESKGLVLNCVLLGDKVVWERGREASVLEIDRPLLEVSAVDSRAYSYGKNSRRMLSGYPLYCSVMAAVVLLIIFTTAFRTTENLDIQDKGPYTASEINTVDSKARVKTSIEFLSPEFNGGLLNAIQILSLLDADAVLRASAIHKAREWEIVKGYAEGKNFGYAGNGMYMNLNCKIPASELAPRPYFNGQSEAEVLGTDPILECVSIMIDSNAMNHSIVSDRIGRLSVSCFDLGGDVASVVGFLPGVDIDRVPSIIRRAPNGNPQPITIMAPGSSENFTSILSCMVKNIENPASVYLKTNTATYITISFNSAFWASWKMGDRVDEERERKLNAVFHPLKIKDVLVFLTALTNQGAKAVN